MKHLLAFLAALLVLPSVRAQDCDEAGVNALIDRYVSTEADGDMRAQARTMADDRVWIAGGRGRMTNQAMNMESQQAWFDLARAAVPGTRWFVDAADRLVRCYADGDMAVASFTWWREFVPPTTATPDQMEMMGDQPEPSFVSLVLERRGSGWTIVHTHSSPLWPPRGQDD